MNTIAKCAKCGWPAIRTDNGWVHAYAADGAWCLLFAGGRLAAQAGDDNDDDCGDDNDCE